MIKKMNLAVVSLSLGAILIWDYARPTVASAGDSSSCFMCDDWEDSEGWWRHQDYFLFFNDKQGVPHASGYGSCATHPSY